MFDFFAALLESDFMPHGACYLWRPEIMWLHIISDSLIAIAYFSIPVALLYFSLRRRDMVFRSVFLLFSAFILLCGLTHVLEVWSVWHGTYWLTGGVKALTGLVSVGTALVLWPLMPQALRLPSPALLRQANSRLQEEIDEHRATLETLTQSESRFRSAFDTAPIGMALVGLNDRFLQINRAFCEIIGFSEAELIDTSVHALSHPDDRENHHFQLQRLLDGTIASFQLERRYLHRTGQILQMNLSISIVRDGADAPRYYIWQFLDVTEHYEAKQALKRSEEEYKRLYNKTPVMLHSIDGEGRLISVSDYWLDSLGYDREEVLGRPSGDFLTPESQERAREMLPAFLRTGMTTEVPYRFVRKDGRILETLFSSIAERDEDGQFLRALAVIVDVTERKQAEAALHRQTMLLKRAEEVAHFGHWRVDVATETTELSDEVYRIFGLRPLEISMTIEAGIAQYHPDDRARVAAQVQAAMTRGQNFEFEARLLRASGALCHVNVIGECEVDEEGTVIGIFGVIHDITERKEVEEALRRETALLHRAEELAGVGHWHLTLPDGPRYWSDEVFRIFGYAPGAIEPTTQFDGSEYHPEDRPRVLESIRQAVASGEAFSFESRLLRSDGTVRHVVVTGEAELGPDGQPDALFGMIQDITEQVLADQEIHALNADLEARVQQRTAELEAAVHELNAFSYSVSHDLRAPLRGVNGFSQMLIDKYSPDLPDQAKHYIERIQANVNRMSDLIDDMLQFARIGRKSLKKREISLLPIIEEVRAELRSEHAGRDIAWQIGELPPCEADPVLIRQVLINLLSNALKYTRHRDPATIRVGATTEDGNPVYFVSDDGIGFDMDYADKLFGVFQRLHRAEDFEGTGVGLAIVKRIIERHGGRIWADAKPDEGATFFFTL